MMSAIYFQNLISNRSDAMEQVLLTIVSSLKMNPGVRAIWEANPVVLDPARTGLSEQIEQRVRKLDDLSKEHAD